MSEVGHNSGNVASAELRAFVERIERLSEERQTINDDIKDVLNEAAGRGYDKKAIRKIVAIRKMEDNKRLEEESVLHVYMTALGLRLPDDFEGDDV